VFSTILLMSLCEFLCLLDIDFNPKFDQTSHFFSRELSFGQFIIFLVYLRKLVKDIIIKKIHVQRV